MPFSRVSDFLLGRAGTASVVGDDTGRGVVSLGAGSGGRGLNEGVGVLGVVSVGVAGRGLDMALMGVADSGLTPASVGVALVGVAGSGLAPASVALVGDAGRGRPPASVGVALVGVAGRGREVMAGRGLTPASGAGLCLAVMALAPMEAVLLTLVRTSLLGVSNAWPLML